MDTSVLVKPSQIHPEREKYVQLLKALQREEDTTNRLGVPIPTKLAGKAKDHHRKNVQFLKEVFRKRHTTMPYKCEEVKKQPMEKLEEEIRVRFDTEMLPKH